MTNGPRPRRKRDGRMGPTRFRAPSYGAATVSVAAALVADTGALSGAS